MKQLILICLLISSMVPRLWAAEPPRDGLKEEQKEPPQLSNGERIEIPDVGFSIVPPNGWMVHKDSHGSSLLFEAPKLPDQTYQPTIQVMVFSKLRYIDEVTMKEYGDLIVEKFGKLSNRVTGYRMRSSEILQMETGDPAILYYTEFQYDDVSIMQMHILISSATNHFLMSYTDIARVFEDESSPGLAIAYTSMHSAQVSSKPPWRWRGFALAGTAVLLVILGWFTQRFMRARRLARLGQRIEEEDSKEITSDEESHYYSRHSPATEAESHLGDDDWSDSKSKAKSASAKKPASKVSQAHSTHFDDDDDEHEVSEVMPISTLEKSLHPGRKRRQEQAMASAQQHQAPPMPQPGMQQPISHQQQPMPVQGQPFAPQPMPQPGMQQHVPHQQPMHPQAAPMQQPFAQQQPIPQPGMEQPISQQQPIHPQGQGFAQQPMTQPGMQQPISQQQPIHPQGQGFAQQPMAQPGMQQPISQQQPMHPQGQGLAQQPMPQPGMQQPISQQQPMHPQGQGFAQQPMPQPGMQQPISQQQPIHPQGQGSAQQPMHQPVSQQQPMQPQGQQPMPQPDMQQPISQQQPIHPQMAPMQHQPLPPHGQQEFAQQPMPQPGMQQQSIPPQQPVYPQGVPMQKQPMPLQEQPFAQQQPMPQRGMQQPLQTPQQPTPQGMQNPLQNPAPVMPQGVQPAFAQQQQPIPPQGMQQPMPPPIMQQATPYAQAPQSQQPMTADSMQAMQNPHQVPTHDAMPLSSQFEQVPQSGFIPTGQPQTLSPVSEQPAYVQQGHAQQASKAAYAPQAAPMPAVQPGYVPTPAPVAQAYAPPPPQAAAPAMPQFPPAADPVMEQPITESRQPKSRSMKKQPLSQDIDDDVPDMTEEARLSEILPKAGTIEKRKPKRKGLFWRKKTDDDDDQDEAGDDKDSWAMAARKKSGSRKGKADDDDDGDVEGGGGDQWAVESSDSLDPDHLVEKDENEADESSAWAPEATKKSEPKKDSLLNETRGPQRLVGRPPQGPVTKENNAAVTEDGWNLSQQVASDHDEEDEEEVG